MNKIILNTLGDKVIVRKAAENGGNAGGDNGGTEGGSGTGENLNIRYLKMAGVSGSFFEQWAIQIKSHQPEYNSSDLSYPEVVQIEGGYFYGCFRNSRNLTLLAISIDVDLPCPSTVGGSNSFREYAHKIGMDDAAIEAELAAIEITKEEFYDLTNYHGVM